MDIFRNSLFLLAFILAILFALIGLVHWIVITERNKNKFSPFSEKSLRSPGYSLGVQLDDATERMVQPLYFLIGLPVSYILIVDRIQLISAIFFGVLLLIALATLARQFYLRSAETRKIKLGLDGEVYTGQELNFLMRDGAYVYHDIPYKYGNIDHVIISTGGIFVIETKAVRKPAGDDGKRLSKVNYENGKLNFPGFSTDYPVNQALRHAEHMRKYIQGRTAISVSVTPVIALPGWFVESNERSKMLVINPKRGSALRPYVTRKNISDQEVDILAKHIDEFARTVLSGIDKFDPDANKKYTFWLNRKPQDRRIE